MKTDYTTANWNLSDSQLSQQYGVSRQAINAARKRFGTQPRRIDWEAQDWSKSNNRLAEELGYTRSYIAEKRWRLQKGPSSACKEQRLPDWAAAKLSERKTVHEWLNAKGVPAHEAGRPLCLLRRLAIALKIHE